MVSGLVYTWGVEHHVVPAESYVKTLDEVLREGVSINMYMAHGGTTREFMNGANFDWNHLCSPDQQYDYDAPSMRRKCNAEVHGVP